MARPTDNSAEGGRMSEKQGKASNYHVGKSKIMVQNSGPVLENIASRFLL